MFLKQKIKLLVFFSEYGPPSDKELYKKSSALKGNLIGASSGSILFCKHRFFATLPLAATFKFIFCCPYTRSVVKRFH